MHIHNFWIFMHSYHGIRGSRMSTMTFKEKKSRHRNRKVGKERHNFKDYLLSSYSLSLICPSWFLFSRIFLHQRINCHVFQTSTSRVLLRWYCPCCLLTLYSSCRLFSDGLVTHAYNGMAHYLTIFIFFLEAQVHNVSYKERMKV